MSKSRSILKDYVIKIEECFDRENLKLILLDVRGILKNNRSFAFFLTKNIKVSEKIRSLCYYNDSIKESVYRLLNNIEVEIVCECGNKCRFLDNNRGYQKFCGDRKCKYLNEKRKISIKETFDKIYGCHPMKTENVKNKLRESVVEKYGHDNIMKYLSENNMFSSPFKLDSVRNKIKDTFDKRYGGHPMQSDDVYEKNLKSRVKFKEFVLPSGNIIKVQGYENHGIKYLLDKYEESDIISGVKEINNHLGIIKYYYKGKYRKYYTDFYIKSEHKIYEVKSIWTYKANIDKNLLKKKACEDLGINFEFLIFDYKGNILNDQIQF